MLRNYLSNSSMALRATIVAVVVASLLHLGMPRGAAAVQKPALKTESLVKSEASLYDTAVREIGRIESMRLTTADEFTRVKSVLERHVPNLKFIRSKLVALALNDATLISAARARTSTTKLAEEFAVELATNSESVFKLSGGAAVRDKISRSFQTDVTMLRRVSEQLKRAASDFKPTGHHAIPERLLPHAYNSVQRDGVVTTIATVVVASLVVSALIIACPPLAIALPVLASLAAGAVFGVGAIVVGAFVVVGAVTLLERVATNVGTEQGRDQIAECLQEVDSRYDTCVAEHPLIALMGGCLAEYLLRAAACLLVE